MTITAEIIKDSVSEDSVRLTTLQLKYPRFIHAEFMTHRMFSRNASSSRAIPFERLLKSIEEEPARPVEFGKNQPGMQADSALQGDEEARAVQTWHNAAKSAVRQAKLLDSMGVHKQVVNRIIEPFSHINVVVSATSFDNFFALRCHKDAQPEIQVLADCMYDAVMASTPQKIHQGQWHLPYLLEEERRNTMDDIHVSVARCARVSYLSHEGRKTTVEEDKKLFDRLLAGDLIHASPAEHIATPMQGLPNARSGNFRGFLQFRKTLPNENVDVYER